MKLPRLPLCLFAVAVFALPASAAPAPKPRAAPATEVPRVAPAQALPPIESVPRPVEAGFVQTVAEKPRLAIIFAGQPRELYTQLARNLEGTRRFAVVTAPTALTVATNALVPGIQPRRALALREAAKVDMVLTCTTSDTGGDLTVSMRLIDLRNGDVSRELAAFGRTSSVAVLAKQLATFVRRAAPLRCIVRSLSDDGVVLDLGSADGMAAGSTFQILRHAQNLRPVPVGVVRVASLEAYTSRAEVEETSRGLTVIPGDVAVEQTGDMALN